MSLLLKALQKAAQNRESASPANGSEAAAPTPSDLPQSELSLEPISPPPGSAARAPADEPPDRLASLASPAAAQNILLAGADRGAGSGLGDYVREHPLVTFSSAAGLFAIGYGIYLYIQISHPGLLMASRPTAVAPAPPPPPPPDAVAKGMIAPPPAPTAPVVTAEPPAGAVPLSAAPSAAAPAPGTTAVPATAPPVPAVPPTAVSPAPVSSPPAPAPGNAQASVPAPTSSGATTAAAGAKPAPPAARPAVQAPAPAPAAPAESPPAPRVVSRPAGAAAAAARPTPTEGIAVGRESAPVAVPVAVAAGYQALQAGRYTEAEQSYREALAADPRNIDAHLGLAASLVQLGRGEAASPVYMRALEIDPRNANAQAGLIGLASRTDPAAAETRLKQLLSREPSAFLHFTLGNLYADQGQWAAAQSAYFQAHNLAPDNPDYAYNLAVGLEHLSQPKIALNYYRRAVQIAQARGNAQFDVSRAEGRIRKLEAALGQ
jgi:Tfp pilus assembly protein PilF